MRGGGRGHCYNKECGGFITLSDCNDARRAWSAMVHGHSGVPSRKLSINRHYQPSSLHKAHCSKNKGVSFARIVLLCVLRLI